MKKMMFNSHFGLTDDVIARLKNAHKADSSL